MNSNPKKEVIFIRTDPETKNAFLKAVKKTGFDQNTLGEFLILKGVKKIIKNQ